jgi:hypothetical protein
MNGWLAFLFMILRVFFKATPNFQHSFRRYAPAGLFGKMMRPVLPKIIPDGVNRASPEEIKILSEVALQPPDRNPGIRRKSASKRSATLTGPDYSKAAEP